MSLRIIATIICEGCKKEVVGPVATRSTLGMETYWEAKRTIEKEGWITVSRGRFLVAAHFCKDCADKPLPKIKKPAKENIEKT